MVIWMLMGIQAGVPPWPGSRAVEKRPPDLKGTLQSEESWVSP